MTNIKVTPDLIERGLALADKCTVFDRPLSEMSRDELIAVAAIAFDAVITLKEGLRDSKKRLLDLAVSNL